MFILLINWMANKYNESEYLFWTVYSPKYDYIHFLPFIVLSSNSSLLLSLSHSLTIALETI